MNNFKGKRPVLAEKTNDDHPIVSHTKDIQRKLAALARTMTNIPSTFTKLRTDQLEAALKAVQNIEISAENLVSDLTTIINSRTRSPEDNNVPVAVESELGGK